MNHTTKQVILILLIVYILSPIDACPGPIDDLIFLIIWIAGSKQIGNQDE